VAKVDRLTRSVAFLSALLQSGVEVLFCDLRQMEGPTGRFMPQQMAAVAELEAGMISARTKAALKAAKARGVKLGGPRNLTSARTSASWARRPYRSWPTTERPTMRRRSGSYRRPAQRHCGLSQRGSTSVAFRRSQSRANYQDGKSF
jgi:DNA invertase Pin-like site-specific DNA recombinase